MILEVLSQPLANALEMILQRNRLVVATPGDPAKGRRGAKDPRTVMDRITEPDVLERFGAEYIPGIQFKGKVEIIEQLTRSKSIFIQ